MSSMVHATGATPHQRERFNCGAKDPVFMDSMAQSPTLISKLVATG